MGIWICKCVHPGCGRTETRAFFSSPLSIYIDQFSSDVENENQSESWLWLCQVKYVPADQRALEVNVQAC